MTTRSLNDKLITYTAYANPSTATDTTIVAAVTNNKIRVHAVFTVAASANSVYFKSGSNAICASSALAANGGLVLPFNEAGWFETVKGQALNFTTSAAAATGVTVVYSLV